LSNSEIHRAACEARHWLAKGYTTPARIRELHERIKAKRGQAAADRLIEDMRREWLAMRSQSDVN
jgi:hypothetical protein